MNRCEPLHDVPSPGLQAEYPPGSLNDAYAVDVAHDGVQKFIVLMMEFGLRVELLALPGGYSVIVTNGGVFGRELRN